MENILSTEELQDHKTSNRICIDESVVKAAIGGCKDSFLMAINAHKEYLYRMAFLYIRNENEALEIYQNTVYKAYINISKLKKPQFFTTWITRILINIVYDTYRQSKKQAEVYKKQDMFNYNYEVDIEDRIVLYDAIDSLSNKHKTSIILRYIHDMPIKDISKVMGCSENTVKSYIHRAKKELMKILKEV